MFASETEGFDTWINNVLMVIRQHSSITLACVKDNHWSDDQQVNVLILNWYCNSLSCQIQLCVLYLKVVFLKWNVFDSPYVFEPNITELEK
jgi:hypothetical protein